MPRLPSAMPKATRPVNSIFVMVSSIDCPHFAEWVGRRLALSRLCLPKPVPELDVTITGVIAGAKEASKTCLKMGRRVKSSVKSTCRDFAGVVLCGMV